MYGIVSIDTDFFGFDIPEHIKLIQKWKFSAHSIRFFYYNPCKIWKRLKLSGADKFQLIRICGNDYYKPRQHALKRLKEQAPDKSKTKLEIVADAINKKQFSHVQVPDIITDFYVVKDDEDTEWIKLAKLNVNTRYWDLKRLSVFSSGLFFHDIFSLGSTIHQKLAPLRRAIYNELPFDLEKVDELVPVVQRDEDEKEDSLKAELSSSDVKRYKQDKKFLIEADHSGKANVMQLVDRALMYLTENNAVTDKQCIALRLQYFVKALNGYKLKEFERFKLFGTPMVEDLSAMWLYLECIRLFTFNQQNIMPFVGRLFDGPLYHFLLYEMRNGDKFKTVASMLDAMNKQAAVQNDPNSLFDGFSPFAKKECK